MLYPKGRRSHVIRPPRIPHLQRRTDLIVRLDPPSWPSSVNAHGTAHSLCAAPIQWAKSPPHSLYASGEYNRTPLDGRALVNGRAGQVYGYLSNALSDRDGLFAADAVHLSCTRDGGNISVLTVCFDPAGGEYAIDFDVTIDGASSTETYHQEWHVRDNDQSIVYITGIKAAYDTVTVAVSRWSHPFRRARIREIANGVLFEATGDSLYSCSLIAESDPTNQSIPTGECTLTCPDPLGMFDPANPAGVSSSITTGQRMAVFIDIISRKVIGWAMDTRIRDTLVLSALNQTVGREHPEEGLIIHTDRGAQYTAQRFQATLSRYEFRRSMSRMGNSYDNAIMESFYRTLKRELVRDAHYDNPEQARFDIFKYIETCYNTKRIHSALGFMSPALFESQNPQLFVRFFLTFSTA